MPEEPPTPNQSPAKGCRTSPHPAQTPTHLGAEQYGLGLRPELPGRLVHRSHRSLHARHLSGRRGRRRRKRCHLVVQRGQRRRRDGRRRQGSCCLRGAPRARHCSLGGCAKEEGIWWWYRPPSRGGAGASKSGLPVESLCCPPPAEILWSGASANPPQTFPQRAAVDPIQNKLPNGTCLVGSGTTKQLCAAKCWVAEGWHMTRDVFYSLNGRQLGICDTAGPVVICSPSAQ